MGGERMTSILQRRRGAMSANVRRLPPNLRRCEWIQGDGTAYIVTAFEPQKSDLDDIEITADVRYTETPPSSNTTIFALSGYVGTMFQMQSDGHLGLGSSTNYPQTGNFNNIPVNQFNRVTVTFDSMVQYATCQGITIQRNVSTSTFVLQLSLFATRTGSSASKNQNAYLRVRQNGVTVMELVSVYDIFTGEIGMYDVINSVFYTNAAESGAFTKGADLVA